MGQRVTSLMLQRNLLVDVGRAQRRLAHTQQMASTGLRVLRPSDDPIAAGIATALRAQIEDAMQLQRNASRAEARLIAVEDSLQGATDVLTRAKELATQAANDTLSADERLIIAQEIQSLHAQMLKVGNTRSQTAYLYSGFETGTPAFSVSGPFAEGSPPPTVSYDGDSNEVQIEVESGLMLSSTLDGRRVFLGDADGDGSPDAGKEDLLDTLASLWNGLVQNDRNAIGASIDRIDVSQRQILVERAEVGTRLQRVDAARVTLSSMEVTLQSRLSDTQDADAASVFSDLLQQQGTLEAALRVTADALQLNLLNFLR